MSYFCRIGEPEKATHGVIVSMRRTFEKLSGSRPTRSFTRHVRYIRSMSWIRPIEVLRLAGLPSSIRWRTRRLPFGMSEVQSRISLLFERAKSACWTIWRELSRVKASPAPGPGKGVTGGPECLLPQSSSRQPCGRGLMSLSIGLWRDAALPVRSSRLPTPRRSPCRLPSAHRWSGW